MRHKLTNQNGLKDLKREFQNGGSNASPLVFFVLECDKGAFCTDDQSYVRCLTRTFTSQTEYISQKFRKRLFGKTYHLARNSDHHRRSPAELCKLIF